MRLSIVEATTRRNFIKSLATILAANNLTPVANIITKGAIDKKLVYGIHASGAFDPRASAVAQDWVKFRREFFEFKKIVGSRQIFLSPDGGDGVNFLVKASPTDLLDLIKVSGGIRPEFSIDDFDEDGSWLEFNNDTSISEITDESFGIILEPRNLLKQWWDAWEKYGENYLDENFAKFLKNNGIDPRRKFLNGDGLNSDYVRDNAIKQKHPENWEREYTDKINIKDQYLASPMHQSFESKLNSILKTIK